MSMSTFQPTKQATTKPTSRLLALYGTPAPIRTEYATRQHPDCMHPRLLVQCPTCRDWQDLTHNAYCHTCAIWLVSVVSAQEVA